MTGWAHALVLLCSTVSAAVIPYTGKHGTDGSVASAAGSADGNGAHSLSYLIPCDNCSSTLVHKSSQINLTISAAGQECGSENTLLINGSPLPYTVWHHSVKQWIHFRANSSDTVETSADFKAYVQLGCLNADTSIISVNIGTSNEEDTRSPVGFAVSFKQQDNVREIRYQPSPIVDIDVFDVDLEWGDPESRGGLVREFQKLQHTEMLLDHLRELHTQQQRRIKDIIVGEFKACDGLFCYLQKARESAPYLSSLIKTLFCQKYTGQISSTASPGQIMLSSTTSSHSQKHDYDHPSAQDDKQQQQQSTDSPHQTQSNPGNSFGTLQTPTHRRLSFAQRHRIPIIMSVISTVVFLSLLFILLKVAKGGVVRCINPRVRRDYAARREERRTRAAYQRAACRQKVRRWWSSLRKSTPTSNYEEKRARILSQEGVLEHVMQNEITQLQRAHEIVTDMMRAEEGRQLMHHQINFGAPSAPVYINNRVGHLQNINLTNNGEGSSAGSRSFSTLPPYGSPPPSYHSDLDGEMTVVDGFNYTPSNSDNTSDSSVVDCTSRLSFDTDSIGTRD